MEILGKCLGRLISLGLLMLILYFVCEFSTSAVVGFGNFNFSDEFYEFNKNGILLYIASIILVLGINFCLIYILQKNIYNKIVLLIFMIVGIIIMIFVIDRWMSWLEILFSKYQLYNYNVIEMGYENLFGNKTKAKAIITVTIVVFFSFNMLFENIEIILDDRTYIKEAFANKNNLMDILACELVIYLFWPAMTIMNRVNISNIIFWTAMIFTGILYLILNIIIWRRMIKYTKLERKEVVYIVISELGEGYFLHQLFKKEYKFLKQLYREQIILISKKEYQRIYKERKNDISLECYMTFYVKESEIQKNHLKDAAFHMAFFDYVGNTEKLNKFFYEVVIEDKSFKETIQQIVPYCNMISYKRSLKECLEIDQYAERKKRIYLYVII